MAKQTNLDQIRVEQDAFDKILESILEEHIGEFVVVKDGSTIDFFDTYAAAYESALERFGADSVFLVSEVKKRGVESVSVSWDMGVMFA